MELRCDGDDEEGMSPEDVQMDSRSPALVCADALRSLPCAPTNGLSLGLCGLGSIGEAALGPRGAVPALVAAACASVLQGAFVLRVLLTPRASLATEFSRPAPLSGLATWQMTFMLLVGRIYGRAVPAAPLVYAGAAAQVALLSFFLAVARRDAAAPFWAPPVVSSGITCLVGAPLLGGDHWLVVGSLLLCASCSAVLSPLLALRTRDATVAPDATIAIVQAPFSLPPAAFYAVKAARDGGALTTTDLDARLVHAAFALSTLGLCLTLLRVSQRRAALERRGFDQAAAAFTFPTCLSTVCAFGYAKAHPPAKPYALLLAAVTAPMVVAIALAMAAMAGRRACQPGPVAVTSARATRVLKAPALAPSAE